MQQLVPVLELKFAHEIVKVDANRGRATPRASGYFRVGAAKAGQGHQVLFTG